MSLTRSHPVPVPLQGIRAAQGGTLPCFPLCWPHPPPLPSGRHQTEMPCAWIEVVLHGSCFPLLPELMVHFGTGGVSLKRFFPPVHFFFSVYIL